MPTVFNNAGVRIPIVDGTFDSTDERVVAVTTRY